MLKRAFVTLIVGILLFSSGFFLVQGAGNQAAKGQVGERYGLVVGVSEYSHPDLNNISFAAKDAKSFYRLLLQEEMGSYSEENLTVLTNESATTAGLAESLKHLENVTDEDDLVVIYYSGHGAKGPDYDGDEADGHDEYFITQDSDPSSAETIYKTAFSDDQFTDAIESMPSDNIVVFLDCAYSGGLIDRRDFPSGTVMIFASSENQPSWESPELNQGVFTHFLLQGLKGKADSNNDGQVTSDELYGYLKPNVSTYVDEHFTANQTPLMKGAISAPLSEKKGKLEGEVKSVVGDKQKATKGDFVMLNVGNKDGVKKDDRFKVYLGTKAVEVVENVHGEIKVIEAVGPHLSFAKITEGEFEVEAGDKVEKVSGE